MQTQIALSTMETEYIALSQSMRDLIPIREVLKEILWVVFNVSKSISYRTHSKSVYSDNTEDEKYNIPQSTVASSYNCANRFSQSTSRPVYKRIADSCFSRSLKETPWVVTHKSKGRVDI
jgi:hypothetical protein